MEEILPGESPPNPTPPANANPEGSDKYASVEVERSPRINSWKEQGFIFPKGERGRRDE